MLRCESTIFEMDKSKRNGTREKVIPLTQQYGKLRKHSVEALPAPTAAAQTFDRSMESNTEYQRKDEKEEKDEKNDETVETVGTSETGVEVEQRDAYRECCAQRVFASAVVSVVMLVGLAWLHDHSVV